MEKVLRVHQMMHEIRTLGPFARFGLWTQGCFRRCPGCMTPESRAMDGGFLMPLDEVAHRAVRRETQEGLTISGGEPFLQAGALAELIDLIRVQRDMGVIIYTGYTMEELLSENAPKESAELLKRVDLLIDGPYVRELNDNRGLRGSSNQKAIFLTDRYDAYRSMYEIPGKRVTELRCTEDGFFRIGVPDYSELPLIKCD